MADEWKAIFAMVMLIGVIFACSMISGIPNRVDDDEARARFAEQAQVPLDQVEIVRNTNNTLPWGDLHDVTYELLIEGKSVSGRCTSGWMGTSPLICRLYWGTPPGE